MKLLLACLFQSPGFRVCVSFVYWCVFVVHVAAAVSHSGADGRVGKPPT